MFRGCFYAFFLEVNFHSSIESRCHYSSFFKLYLISMPLCGGAATSCEDLLYRFRFLTLLLIDVKIDILMCYTSCVYVLFDFFQNKFEKLFAVVPLVSC